MIRRCIFLACLLSLTFTAWASDYKPWPKAVLDAVGSIPVQNEGRIKPLSTAAGYTMLRLNGSRSLRIDGHKLSPTAWLLDVIMRPEIADDYPVFRIEDASALHGLGLDMEGHDRFGRWTFNELMAARAEISEKITAIGAKEEDDRTLSDSQVMDLANNLVRYEHLQSGFVFMKVSVPTDGSRTLTHFLGEEPAGFAKLVDNARVLLIAYENMSQIISDPEELERESQEVTQAIDSLSTLVQFRQTWPAWLPPLDPAVDPTWMSTIELVNTRLQSRESEPYAGHITALEHWQKLFQARDDANGMTLAAEALRDHLYAIAPSQDVADAVASEHRYRKTDLVYRSLIVFMIGFLVLAFLWLKPHSKWLTRSVWTITCIGEVMLVTAITWRCVLRGRPPVTTLYETVLFITGSIVLCALVMEAINRRRVGLSAAVLLGATGLFLARSYEATDASDTMPQLQAVLDTNFWLSTHVTTVTLGYAAGLLAGAIAHYRIGVQWLRPSIDKDHLHAIDRMIYGVTAFGLLFATVGTILGGIWANDSWGRFWGWDPKENGALMICLAQLAMLHGRMCGLIRGLGFAIAAVATAIVVAFSWWQVNLLGVGLHSYGHTSGVQQALYIFYGIEAVLILAGLALVLKLRYPSTK